MKQTSILEFAHPSLDSIQPTQKDSGISLPVLPVRIPKTSTPHGKRKGRGDSPTAPKHTADTAFS